MNHLLSLGPLFQRNASIARPLFRTMASIPVPTDFVCGVSYSSTRVALMLSSFVKEQIALRAAIRSRPGSLKPD